ncbi:MAG: ABC transporter permease [Spirochaetes bacterium]|nr:ABC transporter permease [Spirochaetota bacterium]
MKQMMTKLRSPIVISFIGVIVVLLVGSTFFPQMMSINYLLQQLQMASFLGIAATGAMLVILLGHIDLSLPWTLTAAAIISCAFSGRGIAVSVSVGLLVGIVDGLINGLGVALLRLPSMIWSLAINFIFLGISVFITGGFMPQGHPVPFIKVLGIGRTLGVPNIILVWLVVSVLAILVLNRTKLGRYIYAVGMSEKVAFLSGINTNRIIIALFVVSGVSSALTGILLSGYSNQAFQAMGEPYQIPALAAVVIGGTSMGGGRGSYIGTISGVIFITFLSSLLSVMQIPEAGRQIIFGGIIILMLFAYTRRGEEK